MSCGLTCTRALAQHDPGRGHFFRKFKVVAWGRACVMRGVIHRQPGQTGKIDGSFPSPPAENFQAELFGDVARRVWGLNADAKIATIAGFTPRAARDVLRGLVAPPSIVLAALLLEIAKRPPRRKRRSVHPKRLVQASPP